MRFRPARTAVCTAADIECDLPAPRPPRNSQHHDRSGGGSCASRAAKTQSSAASSPSPRISSSASSGVIPLMSWRIWCMRLTSRKKRSTIVVVVLFHDFAFDVAIFLASYIIDDRADFLGRQHTWPHLMVQFKAALIENGLIGRRRDGCGDLGEVQVHRLGVAGRHDQGCTLALLRADCTVDVGGSGPLVPRCAWTGAALGPAAGDLVLLADAGLVSEPDFYRVAVKRLLARNCLQARGEVFLKSSIAPSACAW